MPYSEAALLRSERSSAGMKVRHAALRTKLKRRSRFLLRATDAPARAGESVDSPPRRYCPCVKGQFTRN